jgi:hypothetical protein
MLVEIYYEVDEFNKRFAEKILQFYKLSGYTPLRKMGRMTMSEVMTILIYYHYSHYKNFKSYYNEHLSKVLQKDFPSLVGYDRFVTLIPLALLPMMMFHIYRCSRSLRTGIYYIDSTRLEVCHPKRAHQNKVFKGIANWGKTSVGWFYGIKLHLIINNLGEVVHTCFTQASTSDSNSSVLFKLLNDLDGWVFGDRGYLLNEERLAFAQYDGKIDFFAKPRKNMKQKNKQFMPQLAKDFAKKRPIIETIIGINKEVFNLEHTRHRSVHNAYVHTFSALCAYSFYLKKPKVKLNINQLKIEPPLPQFLVAD